MLDFFVWAVLLAFVRSAIVRLDCSEGSYNASGLSIRDLARNSDLPDTACNVTFSITPGNVTFLEISGASISFIECAHMVRDEGWSGLTSSSSLELDKLTSPTSPGRNSGYIQFNKKIAHWDYLDIGGWRRNRFPCLHFSLKTESA